MPMPIKRILASCLLISLFLSACQSNSEQTTANDSQENLDSIAQTNDSNAVTEEEVSFNLPSALQIAYVLRKSGVEYDQSLMNNPKNASKYTTTNYKKALNFGVYSTDLAYCIFNKRFQESKESLKACKEIGSSLGLNQAFESDNMAQRFDKNISNEDSVVKIVSSLQLKSDAIFEENKQEHITVLAFTGAWTESLQIAMSMYGKENEQYTKETGSRKILGNILEQLLMSETIIRALKSVQNSETEIPELIRKIEEINSKTVTISAIEKAMERDEDIDFSTLSISANELKPINDLVSNLRNQIIN